MGLGEPGRSRVGAGDLADASLRFVESLRVAQDLSYKPGIAWCLAGLAATAALEVRPARAAQLRGAAVALRNAIGARRAPASRVLYDRALAMARGHLGEPAFQAACAEGQMMPLEAAISAVVDG